MCPNCHKEYETVLTRRKNVPIQEEFPKAPAWQREQLLSGICCDKCWDEYLVSRGNYSIRRGHQERIK